LWLIFFFKKNSMLNFTGKQSAGNLIHRSTIFCPEGNLEIDHRKLCTFLFLFLQFELFLQHRVWNILKHFWDPISHIHFAQWNATAIRKSCSKSVTFVWYQVAIKSISGFSSRSKLLMTKLWQNMFCYTCMISCHYS
jgi:hypothetical protein